MSSQFLEKLEKEKKMAQEGKTLDEGMKEEDEEDEDMEEEEKDAFDE
jgi:hypothetical protein